MLKRTFLLLAAAPAILVGGCTGTQNRGLESVHQPVVTRTDYAFDVNAGPAGLAPGEAARLAGWMTSLRVGYGDSVAVDDPAGGRATRAEIAAQAAKFGLLLADDAPITTAPVGLGMVRVVLSRARAAVPGCPDFTRASQPDFEGHASSNYGCAMNGNLAAMVASPTDLVRGDTGTGVYDPAVGTRAIDQFRKAVPTGGGGTTVKSEGVGGR